MKYILNPRIRTRKVKKKTFVYNQETDDLFELNQTAWLIIELLNQHDSSIEMVINQLKIKYADIPKNTLQEDVNEVFSILLKSNIILHVENCKNIN